jgi:hypothetical protein
MTGLTVMLFDELNEEIEPKFMEAEQERLERPDRQRAMGGGLVQLRAGDNGWTCITDDPATPTNDPMCLDAQWLEWLTAVLEGREPEITAIGIAYMLQGGSVADNNDPSITEPPAGQAWQIDPPHLMILAPWDLDPALYSTDHRSGGPWIMFEGTPVEHLMVPVAEMKH